MTSGTVARVGQRTGLATIRRLRIPAVIGALLLFFGLVAAIGPFFAPYDPLEQSLIDRLQPPVWQDGGSGKHILGTDRLGRDMLSRLLYGSRMSLQAAGLVLLLASVIGTTVGVAAGYLGGRVDAVAMRIVDALMTLPGIMIAMLFAVSLGPSFTTVVIAIVVSLWARFARVMRGEVLSVKERDFVKAAMVSGSSSFYIMRAHVFPNVFNTLTVLVTLHLGWVVIVESSLSFLGAGIPPPHPSWGNMVAEGRALVGSAWWVSGVPGIAIMLLVLSLNQFGDWLRDRLDPRLRQAQ